MYVRPVQLQTTESLLEIEFSLQEPKLTFSIALQNIKRNELILTSEKNP